jgi:oxygen-dependent protoporphyrinogen oxidase
MSEITETNAAATPADVAVVGSGAAGLAAAYRLHRAGYEVKVFEQNDYLGGRIKTLYRDGFSIEEGPTQMVQSYTTILGIIRESGMGDQIIPASSLLAMLDAERRVHDFSIEHVYRDMAKTRLLTAREKLDLAKLGLAVIRHRKQLDAEDLSRLSDLDALSAEQYGRKLLNGTAFDNFVDPVSRGFTGTSPDKVAAADLLWVFATFMKAQQFVALSGGMGSYPKHLSQFFASELNATVVEVEERRDHVDLTWRDGSGVERTESYAGVVIATQPKPAGAIYATLDPWRRAFLTDRVEHTTIVAAHVALDRVPPAKASMVYSTEVSALTPVLAIGLEHNKVPAHVPAGKAVATIYADGQWSRELLLQDDETVIRELIAAGESLVPGVGDGVMFTQVARWPYAWFQAYPGYWQQMKEFRRISAGSDRLVQLAGDYFCTTSLNVASTAGARAARDLHAALTTSGHLATV